MAAPGTFKLNHRTISNIAKYDPDLKAAVDGAAAAVQQQVSPGKAWIRHYTTDRHVAGIMCRAIDQVKHGVLTRALGSLGGRMVHHD